MEQQIYNFYLDKDKTFEIFSTLSKMHDNRNYDETEIWSKINEYAKHEGNKLGLHSIEEKLREFEPEEFAKLQKKFKNIKTINRKN